MIIKALQKISVLLVVIMLVMSFGVSYAQTTGGTGGVTDNTFVSEPPLFATGLSSLIRQGQDVDGTYYYEVNILLREATGSIPTMNYELVFGSSPDNLSIVVAQFPNIELPFWFRAQVKPEQVGVLVPGEEYYAGIRNQQGVLFGVQNIGPYTVPDTGVAVSWGATVNESTDFLGNVDYSFSLRPTVLTVNQDREPVMLSFGQSTALDPVGSYGVEYGNNFIPHIFLPETYSVLTGEQRTLSPDVFYYATVSSGGREVSRVLAGVIGDGQGCIIDTATQWYFLESEEDDAFSSQQYLTEESCLASANAFFDGQTAPPIGGVQCFAQPVTFNSCDAITPLGLPTPLGDSTAIGDATTIGDSTELGESEGLGPATLLGEATGIDQPAIIGDVGSVTSGVDFTSEIDIEDLGLTPAELEALEGGIVPDCEGFGCTFNHLIQLVENGINFVILLMVPIAAVAFAYAGYLLLFSGGNPDKRRKARSVFIKVAIGIVVVLAAWIIVATILRTLGITDGSPYSFIDLSG